jgi:uncharacterized protein YjbJ (UPF0337 family)
VNCQSVSSESTLHGCQSAYAVVHAITGWKFRSNPFRVVQREIVPEQAAGDAVPQSHTAAREFFRLNGERFGTEASDADLIRSFQEKNMKSSTEDKVKSKFHQMKDKTKKELGKLMNDPTLEGKDENKVGRVQRKTSQAGNSFEK